MSGQTGGGPTKGAGKVRVAYVCNACGARLPKWAGQCPDCGGWNCVAEVTIATSASAPIGPAA